MTYQLKARESQILSFLDNHNECSVFELSELCGVSSITIRRDLERMSKNNLLIRTHGGAVKLQPEKPEQKVSEFSQKIKLMEDEKRRIGMAACRYVSDYDTIFMNSGTTVLQFLEHLDKTGVTVVTNNTAAVTAHRNEKVELLLLGGFYNERTESVGGEMTSQAIKTMYSKCTILGANALDLSAGMTTGVYYESVTNNAMISNTKGKVILLVDHTKMEKVANFQSASLANIDVIITDSGCPQQYIEAFLSLGIEVVTA